MVFERRTHISNAVLEILEQAQHAISIPQLLQSLAQKGLTPNKTTIYRIIEKLVQKHHVTPLTFENGVTYFEFSKKHHHHFFCKKCETVFCLPACHVRTHNISLQELLPSDTFKIEDHDFNLYGLCPTCSPSHTPSAI